LTCALFAPTVLSARPMGRPVRPPGRPRWFPRPY